MSLCHGEPTRIENDYALFANCPSKARGAWCARCFRLSVALNERDHLVDIGADGGSHRQ
jgi:hypothetical protein